MVARARQDSVDLGWSDPPPSDTLQRSEQPAVPLDNLDDDEPTRVATSAAAIVVTDTLDGSDSHEEGARVTEPGLAPPPPTSAEIATAEARAAMSEAAVAAAEPVLVDSHVEASPPATAPQPPATLPAVSIPPPPIAPAFFAPASLAPTAVDWNEFASPSLLATMKRTRPTNAWTGVGLFVAALAFAGGIGIGRSMNPPTLPPVAVPAPLPASVAAGSLSPPSTKAGTNEPPAAPVPPSKPLAPFDAKAARAALDDAANAANTCRATGDPKGTVPTTVTFDPSGNVSNVAIRSSRYAGTKTARCIAERLSQARVTEFSGFPEALKKLVAVR
jgi:hypothetical protein